MVKYSFLSAPHCVPILYGDYAQSLGSVDPYRNVVCSELQIADKPQKIIVYNVVHVVATKKPGNLVIGKTHNHK